MKVTSHSNSPLFPPSESVIPSTCIEKTILVFASILAVGALATAATLFFLHSPWMQFPHVVMLTGGASFSAAVAVISLDRLLAKRKETAAREVPVEPPPSTTQHIVEVEKEEEIEGIEETIVVEEVIEVVIEKPKEGILVSQFVEWLFKPLPSLKNPKKDQAAEDLKNEIHKKMPGLLYEPEFYWLDPSAHAKPKLLPSEMKKKVGEEISQQWNSCAKGYPEGALEKAFQEICHIPMEKERSREEILHETVTCMVLAPFFIRLFMALGEKRSQVLPWMKEHLGEWLEARLAVIERPITSRLKGNTPFIFSILSQFLLPLNRLLDHEDFSGKTFFFAHLHQVLFEGIPTLYEKGNPLFIAHFKAIDKHAKNDLEEMHSAQILHKINTARSTCKQAFKSSLEEWQIRMESTQTVGTTLYFLHQTLLKVVLPFLSKDLWTSQENVEPYIKSLTDLKTKFSTGKSYDGVTALFVEFQPANELKTLSYEGPLAVRSTLNTLFQSLGEAGEEFFSPYLKRGDEKAKTLQDLKSAGGAFLSYFQDIFGEKVPNIGVFFAKSYLLAQELPLDQTIAQGWLQVFEEFLRAAGAKDKEIAKFTRYGNTQIEKFSTLTPIGIQKARLLPIQDSFLLALTLIFLIKNIDKALPELQAHAKTILDLIKSLGIPEIMKNMHKTEKTFSLIQKFGGVLRNALTQKGGTGGFVKFVNAVTPENTTLWVLGNEIFAEITKDMRDKAKPEEKDILEFIENFLQPLGTYFLCGAYGKGTRAEKALNTLETSLKKYVLTLYTFNEENAAHHPTKFKETLKKTLPSLSFPKQ